MSAYVCATCGSERVAVDLSRPSLDDRYALGRCLSEAERIAASKAKRTQRPTHTNLVRSDLYEAIRTKNEEREAIRRRAAAAKAATTPGSTRVSVDRMAEGRKVVEDLYR